ncbi:HpcH/HpaI aldolase family protein [Microbacterium sp. A84]|uniref:HpcH/HpaI aldolase family protein n=1 Tax=Microbacterium sp. A84 TaxID=3450715 RepID=UPI003F426ABE
MNSRSVLDHTHDRPALGGWLATPSPQSLQAFRDAGFDYVGIDMQHGSATLEDTRQLLAGLRDSDFPAIVRVPQNDYAQIGKAFDLGASGVIVPMVDTPEQAEAAVAASRFAPRGSRSFGPIRGDLGDLSVPELDERGRCYVQIETALALENARAIAATPGLTGIYVGPGDLSITLGLDPMPGFTSTQLRDQFAMLKTVCDDAGIVFGAHAIDVESTQRWLDWGVRLISVINDAALVSGAARDIAAALGISGAQHATVAY